MRGESARPGKRPLRALSASEKMEAIQRVHEGESKASVARDIGVPESTLRGWCKSEHKIRGMARNSSTPDSEAHSPASSSGANNALAGMTGASNLSSEDEAVVGPTSAKKMKLDAMGVGDVVDTGDTGKLEPKQPKMDYVSSIINSIVASGVRSENSSILLQQLGLLSSAQSAASLTKNLLGLGSSHLGGGSTGSQAVGLVENGLQYTKSSGGGLNSHQHSKRGPSTGGSSSAHGSAIAPTTQLDSVSKSGSRKSLPPAAEAPSTPVPASPRKTSEHHNGALGLHHHQAHQQPLQQHHHHHQQAHQQHQSHSRSSRKDNGLSGSSGSSSARKADEALWLWLAQQQQLLGQQAAAAAASASPYNPTTSGVDGSWFWQWYKQCSFPVVASTALAASPAQHQQQHQQHQLQPSNKSPSKAKALLDNVLCNNNNNNSNSNKNDESARRNLNASGSNGSGVLDEDELDASGRGDSAYVGTTEEAIEHGEKFFKWLDKCSEPSVTRLQILQFKYLLDNLKTCRKKTSSFKQSRK